LPRGERIEAQDPARGTRRVAVIADGRLAGALFVTASGELPPRDWLIAQLAAPTVAPTLLAGRAPGIQADRGPVICVCFDVGLKSITAAIRDQKLADVAAIGAALGAGTNCGSCRPALGRILSEETSNAA
jgi:assimilatory nitrate reductase catalytic subunit